MSYVIKNGDRYVDINGQYRSGLENAKRYDTLAEATLSVQAAKIFGEHVVDTNAPDAMTTLRAQVAEFHAMIGEPVVAVPTMPSDDVVRLRLALVLEETIELIDAAGVSPTWLEETRFLLESLKSNIVVVKPQLVPMTDAFADIAVVTQGGAQTFGINLDAVITNEVHPSNMAKEGAGKDENGKWQKPEGWQPPDIERELRRQGWEGEK